MRLLLTILCIPAIAVGQSLEEGKAMLRAGKAQEARKILERVLERNDRDPEAHYWMASTLMHRDIRDLEAAAEHVEEAVDLDPSNAEYQYLLGGVYGHTAQTVGVFRQVLLTPKIKKAFAKAVELDPDHVEARVALAQFFLMAPGFMGGDDDEGFRHLDEVMKRDKKRGRMERASALELKDRVTEAEAEWTSLAAAHPDDWAVHKGYGYFLLHRKRAGEALKPMSRYPVLRPDTSDAYDSYGEVLLAAGKVDDAITTLRKGLEIEPTLGSSWYLLGQAYEQKKLMAEARKAYQNAVQHERSQSRKQRAADRLDALPKSSR